MSSNFMAFGEFVWSTNFGHILSRLTNLFDPYLGLGQYLQGIPSGPTNDFVWGTNSGLRLLPLVSLLRGLQLMLPGGWDIFYLILVLIFPFICFLLAKKIKGSSISIWSYVGASYFAFNSWVINKLFTGVWQQLFAYSLLPIICVVPEKAIGKPRIIFWTLVMSICISLVVATNPLYLVFPFVYIVLKISEHIKNKKFKLMNCVVFFTLLTIWVLSINAYWWLPSITSGEIQFTAPKQGYTLASIKANSKNFRFVDTMLLDVAFPLKKDGIIGIEKVSQIFLFLTIIWLFIKQKKHSLIIFFSWIFFIFLSKGLNPPGIGLSRWIYTNIPLLIYFRDTSRFIAGVALFGAMAFWLLDENKQLIIQRKKLVAFLIIMAIGISSLNIVSVNWPKISQKTDIPQAYQDLQNYMTNNPDFNSSTRMLIIPSNMGMSGYNWASKNDSSVGLTIFDTILPLPVSLLHGTYYPDNFANQMGFYTYKLFLNSLDPSLLRITNTKYILVDQNTKFGLADNILESLENNKIDYSQIFFKEGLTLYKSLSPNIPATAAPVFAIGDLETVVNIHQTNNAPVILLNQQPSISFSEWNKIQGQEIKYDVVNPIETLAAENLSKQWMINIFSPTINYDQIFLPYEPYKNEVIEKTGALFTSGQSINAYLPGKMDFSLTRGSGQYEILIKAMSLGAEQNAISINIGDFKKEISLNPDSQLSWIDLGDIKLSDSISTGILYHLGSEKIVIDQIIIVDKAIWENELGKFSKLLSSKRLSQSNYSYLTLNNAFGRYWTTDKPSLKFISNGYGMTFAFNNGVSEIQYSGNAWYSAGLFISIISLFVGLIWSVWTFFQPKNRLLHKKSEQGT